MSNYGSAYPGPPVTIHSLPPHPKPQMPLNPTRKYINTNVCPSLCCHLSHPTHCVSLWLSSAGSSALQDLGTLSCGNTCCPGMYSQISTPLFYSSCRYEITALTLPMISNCTWFLQLWKDDSKERCHCKCEKCMYSKGDGLYLLKNALILTVQLAVQWQASMILKTGSPPKYREKW